MQLNRRGILFTFNMLVPLLSFVVLLINDLFLASYFLVFLYLPLIIINRNCNFSSFFYFFANLFYMHRIIIIGLNENEFWYDSYFYDTQSFSDTVIYLSIVLSLVGFIFYVIRFFKKEPNVRVTPQDVKIIKALLYTYLVVNFVVALAGGFTVGYVPPEEFRPFIRMTQFLHPISYLIFIPFFTTREKFIFIFLIISVGLLVGSKGAIYSIFIALLISKTMFNDNRGKNIALIALLGLLSGPLMFLIANYIRYPESFDNASLVQYLISSSEILLYIFSDVSHRFGGYFDTLLAFITNANQYNFDINIKEYMYEMGGAINRMIPGDLFDLNNLYISFEEKSAYELRGQVISFEEGVGRHTESLAFARFYFLSYFGPVLFLAIFSFLYKMSKNTHLLIRLFPYYFAIDMLSGGDVKSMIVIPLNFIVLLAIFKILKISLFNFKQKNIYAN
ncbi:hypothetical protein HOK00_05185 [bacterium]|jgi:hypothetical protein|nr:hypothetical protein [bacterium]